LDPDELIRQDKEKWLEVIKKAKPIMEFVFDKVSGVEEIQSVLK